MSVEQYKEGVCSVENGSAVVAGVDTLWEASIIAGNVFKLDLDGDACYEIASVDSDTQITLSVTYQGATAATQGYMVQRSFTPAYGLARPFQGDADLADILRTQIIDKMDAILAGAPPQSAIVTVPHQSFTQYSNPADTSEHDASVYPMPANTLDTDGQSLRIKVWGTAGPSVTTNSVRIKLGATILHFIGPGASKDWNMETIVGRRGASSQYVSGRGLIESTSLVVGQKTTAEDLTTALDVKVTVQAFGGTAGDVVFEGMSIELLK